MIVAVAWIVRRGLLPLRDVTAEVQRRDVRTLAPLAARTLPQEIEPLVSELNRLLARLQAAFAASTRVHRGRGARTAIAAHGLAPAAAIARSRARTRRRARGARDSLGAAVERAIHLVEQLLTLARNDPAGDRRELRAGRFGRGRRREHRRHARIWRARSIDCQSRCAVAVPGEGRSRGASNAGAQSGRQRRALYARRRFRTGALPVRTRHGALLEVIDTGPGIAAADRNRVFDRFYRRAGQRVKRHRPRARDRQGYCRAARRRCRPSRMRHRRRLRVAVRFPLTS